MKPLFAILANMRTIYTNKTVTIKITKQRFLTMHSQTANDATLLGALSQPYESQWKFSATHIHQQRPYPQGRVFPDYKTGIVFPFSSMNTLICSATSEQLLITNDQQQNAFHLLFKHPLFSSLNNNSGFVLDGEYNSESKKVNIAGISQTQVTSQRVQWVPEKTDPRQKSKQYTISKINNPNDPIFQAIDTTESSHRNTIITAWLKKYIDMLFGKFDLDTTIQLNSALNSAGPLAWLKIYLDNYLGSSNSDNEPLLLSALTSKDANHRSALSYGIESINSIEDDKSRIDLAEHIKLKLGALLRKHPAEGGKLLLAGRENKSSAFEYMEIGNESGSLWLDEQFLLLVLSCLKAVNARPSWYLPAPMAAPEHFDQIAAFLLRKENTNLCQSVLAYKSEKNKNSLLKLLIQRGGVLTRNIKELLGFIYNVNDPQYTADVISNISSDLWRFAHSNHPSYATLIKPALMLLDQTGQVTPNYEDRLSVQHEKMINIQQIRDKQLANFYSATTASTLTNKLQAASNISELRTVLDNTNYLIETMLINPQVNIYFNYLIQLLNKLNNYAGLLDDYKDNMVIWLHHLASNPHTSKESFQEILKFLGLDSIVAQLQESNDETNVFNELEGTTENLRIVSASIDPNISRYILTKVNPETKNSLLHLFFRHSEISLQSLTTIARWLTINASSIQYTSMINYGNNLLLIAYTRLTLDSAQGEIDDALSLANTLYKQMRDTPSKTYQQHAFELLTYKGIYPANIDIVRRALNELLDFDTWYSILLVQGSSKPISEISITMNLKSHSNFPQQLAKALLPYQLVAVFKNYFLKKQTSISYLSWEFQSNKSISSFNYRTNHFLAMIDYLLSIDPNSSQPSSEHLTSYLNTISYKSLVDQVTAVPITGEEQQLAFQQLYLVAEQALSELSPDQKFLHVKQFYQKLVEKLQCFVPKARATVIPMPSAPPARDFNHYHSNEDANMFFNTKVKPANNIAGSKEHIRSELAG